MRSFITITNNNKDDKPRITLHNKLLPFFTTPSVADDAHYTLARSVNIFNIQYQARNSLWYNETLPTSNVHCLFVYWLEFTGV